MFDRGTQIRKLPIPERNVLVEILEDDQAWKKVMADVRRVPNANQQCPFKYSYRHIDMITAAASSSQMKCSEIFLKEWGCSGQQLPTLGNLLEILIDKQLFRAADYVAEHLLNERPPERPVSGLAAEVPVPIELLNARPVFPASAPPLSNIVSEVSQINGEVIIPVENAQGVLLSGEEVSEHSQDSFTTELETVPLEQIFSRSSAQHISYSLLHSITNGFNDNPDRESGGRLLGRGGFGSVYLGIQNNDLIAVKRLHKNNFDASRVFQNEVKTLLGLKHPNLLHMEAYSCDGPANCVVYEYMWGGDLQERLSMERRWESPLSSENRIKIALGSSEGLKYLHEDHNPPLVHRDVKSANILLDKNLVPKIGDFGLARFGSLGDHTSTVIGTDCYMAPEAMSGEVTVKIDVFSFGVVLLELLTSLSPLKSYGDGLDLVFYVQEKCEESIAALLDMRAGTWINQSGADFSEPLHMLAQDCLQDDSDARPYMSSIETRLCSMVTNIIDPKN